MKKAAAFAMVIREVDRQAGEEAPYGTVLIGWATIGAYVNVLRHTLKGGSILDIRKVLACQVAAAAVRFLIELCD